LPEFKNPLPPTNQAVHVFQARECHTNTLKKRKLFSSESKPIDDGIDDGENDRTLPQSINRCWACRAGARHQQSFGGNENANHSVKLYSDAVKNSLDTTTHKHKTSPSTPQHSEQVRIFSVNHGSGCDMSASTASTDTSASIKVNTPASTPMNDMSLSRTGSTNSKKDSVVNSSERKSLRPEAVAFFPDGSTNVDPNSYEAAATGTYAHHCYPAMNLLTPNCPEIGSSNALHLNMANFEVDSNLHDDVYNSQYNMVNYIPGRNVNFLQHYPWCTLSPRMWSDRNAFGNEEYKVQIADPSKIADRIPRQKENLTPGKQRWTIEELKKMQNNLNLEIIKAQLAEQARTIEEISRGPGPYPHTRSDPIQPIEENMWLPPIKPGHRYTGKNALPHPRSREWDEVAEAVKLLNLEYLERDTRAPKWWEPPVPMGFDARARFNQPPPQPNSLSSTLRCGGKNEWDWVKVPIAGCKYCGDDRHLTGGCHLRKVDAEGMRERCINCNEKGHFLRDCTFLPVFDSTVSRARKLQLYAHTEHWRQTLHQQHSLFVNKQSGKDYPKLDTGMGDASLAFSWLNCTPCQPNGHWDAIQSNVERLKAECEALPENEESEAYWNDPQWLLEYKNCPVIWNVMHKQDPSVEWTVFNPLSSVAVDAFWRTGMKAMGWDAPELPNGETV
jgi:hypothetical protein